MSHDASEPLGADEGVYIARGVLERDRTSIARGLNLLEDRRASTREARRGLLRGLANARRGHVVGITGPPGAGKSTLCSALARSLRGRGDRVGILAVDPSSARSGGALLGDRVRIVGDVADPGLFVRSLATGGELGGLARAAPACIELLAACSDFVLVETVGIGQSEIDIAQVADVTVVVIQPASGDTLQFLKAGVLEIPDVVVVGKSDLGDVALRTQSDLRQALQSAASVGIDAERAVLCVSGATGEGVQGVIAAIESCLSSLRATGELDRRRQSGALERGMSSLVRAVGELGIDALGGSEEARRRLQRAIDAGVPALESAEALVDDARVALRR